MLRVFLQEESVYSALTLVLDKVAHPGPARKDQLRDVLDNLGLVFGGQRGEPLGKALQISRQLQPLVVPFGACGVVRTTLPWRERRIRYLRRGQDQ